MSEKPAARRSFGPRGPGGPMMGGGEKAKDFKGSLKKLLHYLSPYKYLLLIVIIVAALSSVFNILGPKILMHATEELVKGITSIMTGAPSGIDFGYIGQIILELFGLYLLSACFFFIQGFVMSGISTKVAYNLRVAIMRKINKLPFAYFHRVSQGEVLSRITNDIDTLNQSMNQSVTQLITSTTTVIGVIIMMLTISWQLTLVALLILPITMGLVMVVVKFSQKHFKGQQKFLGAVNGHVEEMYGGHVVVKAFNMEGKSLEKFDEQNNKLYGSAWKAQFFSGLMMPIMNFVGNLGYVAICIIGAALATSGSMTIAGIQAFMQYMRQFTMPISQLANISNLLQQTLAAAERVFEFLAEEEEPAPAPLHQIKDLHIKGDVRFEHVRFGYENTDEIVIKNFNCDVKSGQKIAIVGPTGAGKTTLVKLLMRFHDLKSGAIYLDGYDIKDFARSDLRTEFGMVLQDAWLYSDTIMENIRYGRLNATDEEVYAAARAAQVDTFIRTLPDGYNTILNEEASNVSQGQKQLLTIARAVLADNAVMILDEATSSVDTRTEILIQKAMDHLMKGRTSFIIAHRLSTIRNADLILCMNDGDIIEQGTHDELMAHDGFYKNLYNSQFEKVS